jgi:hypothetical protein
MNLAIQHYFQLGKRSKKQLSKYLLVDALEDISFKENVNINLYYTVRDDHKTSNRDYLTKKGFELV